MRGEQKRLEGFFKKAGGSSPHAWGTALHFYPRLCFKRFIPTCVGNRSLASPSVICGAVHPHMRGEQPVPRARIRTRCGSSPHAWGTASTVAKPQDTLRFIPTCVGNSEALADSKFSNAVHPHMRGEQPGRRLRSASPAGSSPHAWGTDRLAGYQLACERFIPTCVGNRLC